MARPSQPLSGTAADADAEGCKNCEAEENVEKVKYRQLLQVCQEQVGEDCVRGL